MDSSEGKLGRSFSWHNATQFLGALNDNIFRWLIIFFLIGTYGDDRASGITAVVGAVFVVPFLLFTAFAGKLADKFSKSRIIVSVKVAEVVVMAAGAAAFMLGSPVGIYIVLFLMCTQSAFFGPSKYGIVPELVEGEQLSRANSFLEAMTYSAIVIGTAAAPFLVRLTGERYFIASLVCVVVAAVGLAVSFGIGWTEPVGGGGKKASVFFVRDVWQTLRSIRGDKDLMLAVFASAYFMLLGGFMQMNLIPYGMQALGFDKTQSGYLFVIAAVGIGAGSFWAGRLSGRNVEFGIVPAGAIGLALSSMALAMIGGSKYPAFAIIFLLGVSAGLFIVPIHAFIQLRSPDKTRGEVVAASGFLGWVGVLISAGLLYLFGGILAVSAGKMFMVLGLLTLVLAVMTVIILPDFLVRFIVVVLTRFCYRIKVVGQRNVPSQGGVLLVCNHVSWVDAVILLATQQRRIRFVMDRGIYNNRWFNPIFRLMRGIPISATDPPKRIVASLRQARSAMDEGFIVCIFAEGAVTRNGMLQAFRGGFERIMRGSSYSVVPAYIGGAWGSIFSYYYGKLLSTLPRKFPYPVSVHFGEPMAADSTSAQIRQKVLELSSDYFQGLKKKERSLGEYFIQTARRNWLRHCTSDVSGKKLNYGQTLAGAVALGVEINSITLGQEKVGILLPPCIGAAVTNLAVTISGKVAVNLNYSVSEDVMASAINQCGIKTIISSRKFMKKAGLSESLGGVVFIEEIAKRITIAAKVRAYLKAWLVPSKILANAGKFNADDLATVIFSSGSSGDPKGVMLSHHNILSNSRALRMVFQIKRNDDLCGVLPFFHSFGYTCALWLPLISGISASYIPNPLDSKMVGKSVRRNGSTILFAPPTFLMNYARRIEPEDFSTLREVAAGAEKLKTSLSDLFEEKFGIKLLEGYGATELSPVISLNVLDVEVGGARQVGRKPGSVGHPIPGVAVKVVDPESGEVLDAGRSGLIMVKGPNVMLGYLGREKETAEVFKDGWYDTGDIGCLDEDGFITITDRISRFSKIGGEMVPHIAVEEVCLSALGTHEQLVAVTSVPNEKKGEELVVLYLAEAGDPDDLYELVSQSSLPNIWKPRRDNYIMIDSMLLLGSGKLDLMGLRKIAMEIKNSSEQ